VSLVVGEGIEYLLLFIEYWKSQSRLFWVENRWLSPVILLY
jgi:hypothetical protein